MEISGERQLGVLRKVEEGRGRTHKHNIKLPMHLFIRIKRLQPIRCRRMLELQFPHRRDEELEVYLVVFYQKDAEALSFFYFLFGFGWGYGIICYIFIFVVGGKRQGDWCFGG
jgi:hypothetical protein